jgi:predicted XRE-type DNA-binding protein
MEFTFDQFETIGTFYGDLLKRKANIKNVDDFLRATNHGKDFTLLLEQLNTPDKKEKKSGKGMKGPAVTTEKLVKWSEILDLFSIPKVSPRMAELLVHAEINSVKELSHRDPVQVWYKIKDLDEQSYFIIIKAPSLTEIESWVYYARLMTRRIKTGYDVPLIRFPVMTLDYASELQKFKIWTIEDLESNDTIVPTLSARIGMPRTEFAELLGMCDLCRVDGTDVLLAQIFVLAGIKSLQQFRVLSVDEVSERIAKVKDNPIIKEHPEIETELSKNNVAQLLQNAQDKKIKSFLEVME